MLRKTLLRFGCNTLKWLTRSLANCSGSLFHVFFSVISDSKVSHTDVGCIKDLLKPVC